MKHFKKLLALPLLACAVGAWAQSGTELVVLPAPADAWRTVVSNWDQQAELSGSTAAVSKPGGAPAAYVGGSASVSGGRRDALLLEWRDAWYSALRIESPAALDLRPFLGGTLELDLHVDELAKGGVRIKLACGDHCERSVSLVQPARSFAGKGWQHVSLALSCFVREGADFSKVKLPFALEGTGSGRVSVANVRFARAGKPSVDCPDYRTESVTPAMLGESWALDWWLPRHQKKLEEARQLVAAGKAPELVFIGDSITQGWENEGREIWQRHYARYNALGLGFGGDRTENVLWRLQHGALDGLAPKVTVLMIGTNNTGHRGENPETTAAGIQRLVEEIRRRLPATQVLLLGVFPRDEKPGTSMRRINERVNQIIAGYADGRSVHFLDIGAAFTRPDGTLPKDVMPDMLHLSDKGYAIWQREMDPLLQKLMGQSR